MKIKNEADTRHGGFSREHTRLSVHQNVCDQLNKKLCRQLTASWLGKSMHGIFVIKIMKPDPWPDCCQLTAPFYVRSI